MVARGESGIGGGSARLDSPDPYIVIIIVIFLITMFSSSIIFPLSYSLLFILFLPRGLRGLEYSWSTFSPSLRRKSAGTAFLRVLGSQSDDEL